MSSPTMVEIWKAEGMQQGIIEGEAKVGRHMVLAVLRARFGRVPNEVEQAVHAMSDPIALESWAVQTATCQTIEEFVQVLM